MYIFRKNFFYIGYFLYISSLLLPSYCNGNRNLNGFFSAYHAIILVFKNKQTIYSFYILVMGLSNFVIIFYPIFFFLLKKKHFLYSLLMLFSTVWISGYLIFENSYQALSIGYYCWVLSYLILSIGSIMPPNNLAKFELSSIITTISFFASLIAIYSFLTGNVTLSKENTKYDDPVTKICPFNDPIYDPASFIKDLLNGKNMLNEQLESRQNQEHNNSVEIDTKVYEFYNGLARVKKNSKWGLIDQSGKIIIPIKYDELCRAGEGDLIFDGDPRFSTIPRELGYSEGLIRVKLNNQYGYVDKNGKEITSPQYDSVLGFFDGMAVVEKNKKFGFINTEGQEVIPVQYEEVHSFGEGLAAVKKNGKWGFSNKKGKIVIFFQYDNICNLLGATPGRFQIKGYVRNEDGTVSRIEEPTVYVEKGGRRFCINMMGEEIRNSSY